MNWSRLKVIFITITLTLLVSTLFTNMRRPQKELAYKITDEFSVSDSRFAKAIGDLLDPAFVGGNRVTPLQNGAEIFPEMLKAIREAKKTISFESYIYWSGKIGAEFAEALAERARAKVRVHLLIDWAGSGKIDAKFLRQMEDAGVEIERYHKLSWYNLTRLNNRTHRKILVVDGRIGFTGGVGIADEWNGHGDNPKQWRDSHYKVEGPVVNQMQSAFMDNWLKVRSEVHVGEDYFPELTPIGHSAAQMFISSNEEGGSSVRIMYMIAIAAARKTIRLESAYFVPDDHTVDMLLAARARGVDIEIILPGEYGDSEVVSRASRELLGPLLRAGVRIFEFAPAMFHCKVMVVDSEFASVGSTNFDERSFRLNDEANLNVLDREFAQSQLKVFETDRANSNAFTLESWKKRPLSEKISARLMSVFNSQL